MYVVSKENITEEPTFIQMAEQISRRARISANVVAKYAELAIQDWERENNTKVSTIFYLKSELKGLEVKSIIEFFMDRLRPYISSNKKLLDILKTTSDAFNEIFMM